VRAADRDALARAGVEGRVLVTFDRDFGALAFKHGASAPAGILLLRFVPMTPEEPAAVLLDLFCASFPWEAVVAKHTRRNRRIVRFWAFLLCIRVFLVNLKGYYWLYVFF
jgi:predicted nuclease of predicted toxin-antitoxin system